MRVGILITRQLAQRHDGHQGGYFAVVHSAPAVAEYFVAYVVDLARAEVAIRLAGVDAVARCDNATEWQSIIGERPPRATWRRKGGVLV